MSAKIEPRLIYVVGGTRTANGVAVRLLSEGYAVKVSALTEFGAALSEEATGVPADSGAQEAAQMAARMTALGAAALIDCSHPFAEGARKTASAAAATAGLPYLRFCRPALEVGAAHAIHADTWPDAVGFLRERGDRALLTVGSRRLDIFVQAGLDFAVRILPRGDSIAACEEIGIEPRNIIAASPPHSTDFNRACIRHARAKILVSKESGREGGLGQKVDAAAAENVPILIVRRPPDPVAIHDIEWLLADLSKRTSCAGRDEAGR